MAALPEHLGKILKHQGIGGKHLQHLTWLHQDKLALRFQNGPGATHPAKIYDEIGFIAFHHNPLQEVLEKP
jgi:hypothetical protein